MVALNLLQRVAQMILGSKKQCKQVLAQQRALRLRLFWGL
jgi:hypothetical protein